MENFTFNSVSRFGQDEAIQSDGKFRLLAGHASDYDLERYYLGMIVDEKDLVVLEEHLLICPECIERAEASDAYVDQVRAAIIKGRFDLR
jgi:hypothetical protein